MTALEGALALWRQGLSIIPVPRPRAGVPPGSPGDGKVPGIVWKSYQERRATKAEVTAWFTVEQNVAIVTGALSGVVVVDADSPAALQWCISRLPYTPWQTKTARGFHLFYAHPGVSVRNRAKLETGAGKLDIDLRADGGYVIAPGSLHASGASYDWAGDWSVPRDKLPRFWPGWVSRPYCPRPAPAPVLSRPTGDLPERARRYLAAIPRPEIGGASDTATLRAACRLTRGFGLSASDAITLLWEWAGGRPGWTKEWVAEKVANALRYGSEPIGGLR